MTNMQRMTDGVVVFGLLALAGFLYYAAPVYPLLLTEASGLVTAQPIAGLERGTGPNLALQVADFAGARWRADNVTVVANAAIGPNNAKTAYRLVEANDGGLHRIETKIVGAIPGHPNTLSLFVKAAERSKIRFEMRDEEPGKYGIVVFDLSSKMVIGTSGDVSDGGMQELPGGWYRCWAAMPYATTTAVFNFALLAENGAGTYAGNSRSGLLIWGVQFEPDADRVRGYFDGKIRAGR